ncbi:MAG: D-alanyl-D-alanine carboxypeptidase/D-alanyl-D-alanine endopeptidase [Acidiferrobacterales bacterium]
MSVRVNTVMRVARLFALLVMTVSPIAWAKNPPGQQLPAPVAAVLRYYGMPARSLSIVVRPADGSSSVLDFNADVPRSPASTLKLLTTLVSLEKLGPAYTWKTEAYGSGPVRRGTLEGNLYIKGYGDPDLVIEDFWRFLHGLRESGIRDISGDLVLDRSYFAPADTTPGEFDGHPLRPYNVLPSALLVNFQAVRIRFFPEPRRHWVRIVADPLPDRMSIVNHVRLVSGSCLGGARAVGMQETRSRSGKKVTFSGDYAAACGQGDRYRVLSGLRDYMGGIFRELWTGMGGHFSGHVRFARVPPSARLLYTEHSPPLAVVIRDINKYSNNVMARQLLLTLGAKFVQTPGTVEKGDRVVRAWLAANGMSFPELVVGNGSGLSRRARISARHLADVLIAAYNSPEMPEFFSSLPILSVDGTMKDRLDGTLLAGRAHLKTGSLNGVRSTAGIMLDDKGRRMVVVCLQNDPRADTWAGEAVQNALLKWIYHRP